MADFAALKGREQTLEWRPPRAGPIAFPRLLAPGGKAADHCARLLANEKVMLIPEGEFYSEHRRAAAGGGGGGPLGGVPDGRLRVGLGRAGMVMPTPPPAPAPPPPPPPLPELDPIGAIGCCLRCSFVDAHVADSPCVSVTVRTERAMLHVLNCPSQAVMLEAWGRELDRVATVPFA